MLSQLTRRVTSLQDEFRSATGDLTARVILLESKMLTLESERRSGVHSPVEPGRNDRPSREPAREVRQLSQHDWSHAGSGNGNGRAQATAASKTSTATAAAGAASVSHPQYRVTALDSVFSNPVRSDKDGGFRERESDLQKLQESIAKLRASTTSITDTFQQDTFANEDVHTPPDSPPATHFKPPSTSSPKGAGKGRRIFLETTEQPLLSRTTNNY